MKTKDKITIVTVTYNAEQYLEKTIQSVISQDYPNIEYIIIDGASSDGTVELIKKYEHRISYWVSERDNGIYDAMNKAIEVSSGEWINFMNAGDCFASDTVISQAFSLVKNDTDLLCGDINNRVDGKYQLKKAAGLSEIYNGFFTFCCHQALFAKSSLLKKYKFDTRFRLAGDFDFILKCYADGYRFQFLDLAIVNYMNDGASKQLRVITRLEELFILTKHIENIENIFKSKPFLRLLDFNPDTNMLFASMFNNFQASIQSLDLANKKFVLYGFGNIGQMIYEKYAQNVINIVDKNFAELNRRHPNIQAHAIDDLKRFQFDYILITVLGREEEISEYLISSLGIDKDKILQITTNKIEKT